MRRHGRKKITTWDYDDNKGGTLKVNVYQVDDAETRGVTLSVDIPELDVSVTNSDINALRSEVFAAIKTKLVLTWKRFLYVETSGAFYGTDEGEFVGAKVTNPHLTCGVEMKVKVLEIATRPDGSQVWREGGYYRGTDGLPDVGPNEYGVTHSLIPDTPQNRQALLDLVGGLDRLNAKLGELLHPDNVEATIATLVKKKTLPILPPE